MLLSKSVSGLLFAFTNNHEWMLIGVDFYLDIRRFDAHVIPLEGPTGLLTRVEKLLNAAPPPALSETEKRELLDSFVKVVLQNS